LADRAADLVGAADPGLVIEPMHPRLRDAARRYRDVRLGRTHLVIDALVPAIVEQKVTANEAFRSWRQLLTRFGAPAPGPAPDGLRTPPDARAWALIPSWEWHRAGVGPERAATVVRAIRAAARLEAAAVAGADALDRALRAIPGIGAWTSSEVRQRALGDPDAVSVGDYHLPKDVGYVLTGERTDDAGMLRLLQPWAGNRYRVIRLIELTGAHAPRRGPRATIYDHRGI
jgi:3-methyladenine DNA glycosylase/8-oxoguanine DNA glycosylase